MVDQAEEALRQAGLLGGGRVVATEPLTGGQVSSVYKVLLSTGRAVVLKIAKAQVVGSSTVEPGKRCRLRPRREGQSASQHCFSRG